MIQMENSLTSLIQSLMSNVKTMVDVNTIIGDPVNMPQDTVIIPISKVTFGVGAGGSEFEKKSGTPSADAPMFGGGGGGGGSVKPMAFLVINNGNVRLMPLVSENPSPVDKLIDMAPDLIDKVNGIFQDKKNKKPEDDNEL